MRHITPNPRGMALVMAMIVVVLITLLVAGAISFTGTERAASEIQTQEDVMSSCVQAARNLFLSKVRMSMLPADNPSSPGDAVKVLPISFNEDLPNFNRDPSYDPNQPPPNMNVRTGHLGELMSWSAKQVTALDNPMDQVSDDIGMPGAKRVPTFYIVTAVCRETQDLSSPEREIEFMVRVGF